MTNQQQPIENENLLNPDEAKAAIEKWFASAIGTLSLNNATLEKRLASSQQIVRQLAESIADLEADVARLRHQLSSLPQPLSLEAAALAATGRAAIQDSGDEEKEKATPV